MPVPPSAPDSRRARVLYLLVAVLVPCLVVAWANGVFTYNHFYATGPFIHDAGWFSHTVFRQGLAPSNPPAAEASPSYFSLHVSLLVVLGSVLSTLFPGDRVDWYCLFQAAIYAPLGASVAWLVPSRARSAAIGGVAAVGAASLAFAFNGEAIACMGYPHFEIAIATGICLMLAGLATERPRTAWAGLAIAIGTREDGGAHAATFLVAVLACGLVGRPFPVTRKRIVVMTAVAAVATFALMAVQKKVFHGASLFQQEYLGEPAYAHITLAELRRRLGLVLDQSLFVVFPIVATVVIAAIDRDARWLLGWAVTLPWLLLNFLAHQAPKVTFDTYVGFPFIAGMFWLGAYAVVKYGSSAPPLRMLARLAVVSLASSVGMFWSYPGTTVYELRAMAVPRDVDGPAMRRYARTLRASPNAYGHILTDPSMASWVTEALPARGVIHDGSDRDAASLGAYDAFTFFRTGLLGGDVFNVLANGHFSSCGELPRTAVVLCNRRGSPLPPAFVAVPLLKQSLFASDYVRREPNGDLLVLATPEQRLGLYGPFARLAAGRYRAVFGIRMGECPSIEAPRAEVEVFARSHVLGTGVLRERSGRVHVDFDAPASSRDPVELRTFTGACPYTVESVDLEAL